MLVAIQFRQHVGDAGDSGPVADPRGHDLVVDLLSQLGFGKTDFQPQLLAQLFGLFIEEQKHRFARVAVIRTTPNQIDNFLVFEQIIVDVFNRSERAMWDL